MIVYPNAKINIGLNVTEKRPDGYHNIETIFYPIAVEDALEITKAENNTSANGYSFHVSGTILDGTPDDNLVVRAYKLMRDNYKLPEVNIHLHKQIPTGAGLGGGSSDAAFTLKLLNDKFKLNIDDGKLEEMAAKLGADCPFFIKNRPVFASGIGNVFKDIDLSLKGKYLLLVKPDIFVSTPEAYSMVKPHKPSKSLTELINLPLTEWKDYVVNDFEPSVFASHAELAAIKDKIYDLGAVYAAMSGSGSTMYGIFDQPIEHVNEIFSGNYCSQTKLN